MLLNDCMWLLFHPIHIKDLDDLLIFFFDFFFFFFFFLNESVTGLTLQSSMVKCENNQATSLKLKAPTNISYLVLEPPKQSSQIMDLTLVASPKSSKVSS
jgi:hypothetical protein